EIIEDGLKNLGPTQNFNRLMEYSQAEYICFCDQDDKWLPNKLSRQMEYIQSLEEEHKEKAILVFCDLILCDEQLNIVSPSLIEKDRLNTDAVAAHQLLMQNIPYGCATIINRKLLDLSTPINERALLHDHWLAVISALVGKI